MRRRPQVRGAVEWFRKMKTGGVIYPEEGLGPARDGSIHVNSAQCATCIFRPGNLMNLAPGRVAQMKQGADERGTCIVCHENMNTPQAAVCRGYYDRHNSWMLRLAFGLGLIREQGASDDAPPQAEKGGA